MENLGRSSELDEHYFLVIKNISSFFYDVVSENLKKKLGKISHYTLEADFRRHLIPYS